MSRADMIGDLRSALARVSDEDLSALEEIAFILTLTSSELDHPDMFESMKRMVREKLDGIAAGRASAWDRVEFVTIGAPALTRRLAAEAPWVREPTRAAAAWLAAFCWQMTANVPSSRREECVHVYMGLGGGLDLRLLWDIDMTGWFRYVLVSPAMTDTAGAFTHNATDGRPGLPEGVAFGPEHVDADAAAAAVASRSDGESDDGS